MEKIRRNERLAILSKWLSDAPYQTYTLSQFCNKFNASKSTMSEDIELLSDMYKRYRLGTIETIAGASGGVRYVPSMPWKEAYDFLFSLSNELSTQSRLLPGGFLYLTDILNDPVAVSKMGAIIAQTYAHEAPDFILTMETKGIPVALVTAKTLNIPLVVARRAGTVYEGSAVNINYLSASAGKVETMCLSRRAVKEGQRTLIVDDFIKGGCTAKGMADLMHEFSTTVVGSAFVIASEQPDNKMIQNDKALMVMQNDENNNIIVKPSQWLTSLMEEEEKV